MVRLVLFDIDGTLINSGGAGEKAFGRIFATIFHVPNGTEKIHFAGRTDSSIVREFFVLHHISPGPENFARCFDAYVFWLDHMLHQLPGFVLPGVHDLLDHLRALPQPPLIGLLTGNIRLGAQIKLGHFNLWDSFVTGGFGDDHEDRCEIAAVARQRGCRMLGASLRGEEVLVIGDTPFDIACAHSIEARVLAVATGKFTTTQLESHKPTWVAENLSRFSARELCG